MQKILIVEDETRISTLLKMYLIRESFDVEIVDNGNDGLARALENNFDLIILDLFIPGKNGFQLLEELRKVKQTPVIMVTAQSQEHDLKRGMELGANEYIQKPFSPGEVVLKIKKILA